MDKGKLTQLQQQLAAAQKNVGGNQAKVNELQKQLDDVNIRLDRAQRDYQYAKATYDHDRYDFEASRAAQQPGFEKKGQSVAEQEKNLSALNLQVEKLIAERAGVQKSQGQYTGQVTTIAKQIEDMHGEETRLRKVLDSVAPGPAKDYFLNAPLLDFLAPTIKIQQLILPNIVDDVNFKTVSKMDRCMTCHLSIDRKGYRSTRSRSRRIPTCPRTSAATRRIRSTASAARCATRGWGSPSASATRRTCRAPKSSRRSGRRSSAGSSHTSGTTRCCR